MKTPFWADLPVEAQVVLASGYIAYSLGYFGIRQNHKVSDTVFRTLAFSLVASLGMYIVGSVWTESPIWIKCLAALGVSVVVGCIWRKFGSSVVVGFMRKYNISWSSDERGALATVTKDSKYYVSQISVKLHDGSWLCCDDTSVFSSAPFGPCIISDDGSVAMYLTHTTDAKGIDKKMATTANDDYGYRLTYIPADRVSQLNIRHVSHP